MAVYNQKRVGETHTTKQGYTCSVIAPSTKQGRCVIKIEDWVSEAYYDNVKKGGVNYPFNKSIHNVGYIGEGLFNSTNRKKAYTIWANMLRRCYSSSLLKDNPSYETVEVDEEWHNFQNFVEWYETNYIEGFQLDKDLLSGTLKVYSPTTCIFLPQELNVFLSVNKATNTSGTTGVVWSRRYKKWVAQITEQGNARVIGKFKDKENATKAYKKAREDVASTYRQKYAGVLSSTILDKIK